MRVVRRLVVCAAAVGEKFQFTVQTRDLDVSRFFFFVSLFRSARA